MEDKQKSKWDYVLCHMCPTKNSEYFVLGKDVGKTGKGVCPTCGTEIFHVRCDECGDQFEIDKTFKEFHPEDNTWECLNCRSKERKSLPTEKINIVSDLPPELEQEFRKQGAAMLAKLKTILTVIILAVLAGVLIELLK